MAMYEETLKLLENRPRKLTYAQIERDIGVNESWLRQLASGKIDDPGVKKIQKLNIYLKEVK
jgi:transcriptional regulator with XRE-family HTH domain